MKNRIFLLLILPLILLPLQAHTPVGQWTNHSSYRTTTIIEETANKIFAIADNHLYSVSKDDGHIDTYSKTDGFCSTNIQCVAYDKNSGKMVIAYTNSNIDVIDANGTIYNIPDFFRKEISTDKTINKITFLKGNAYLATNMGIVVLNLKKYEIKDTYIIGDNAQMNPVYAVEFYNDSIYALMDNQIKANSIKHTNLLDFSSWSSNTLPKLPSGYKFTDLTVFGGYFVLATQNSNVFRCKPTDSSWQILLENPQEKPIKLHKSNDNLLISAYDFFIKYDTSWLSKQVDKINHTDVLYSNNVYWLACGESGLVKLKLDEYNTSYLPYGPYTGRAQKIIFDGDKFVVAPGFSWLNRGYSYNNKETWKGAVMLLQNEKWTSYTGSNSGALNLAPDRIFYDVVSVAVDPKNKNHIFASTWGEGVYEFLNGKAITLYDKENTNGVLQDIDGYGVHYVRVDGLTFDKEGNLYVLVTLNTSKGTANSVVCMTPSGEWKGLQGYSPVETYGHLLKMFFHTNGQSWVLSARNPQCIFIKKDNKTKSFSTFTDKDGRTLSPSFIYDMVEDKDGNVWVGTSAGPVTFTSCANIFDSNYRCTRIKIPRNDGTGLADYLLDGIGVKAIAIDGANRKWIGTENSGLFLISADGLTTIHHFTTDNSPLPSNEITAIAINSNTGEVLIGTTEGLICYGGDSTEPVKNMKKGNIYVYPNPVKPDYTGMITIVGLEENTTVKITDASGHLVFEGVSNGGSFAWNGKNFRGQNVSGGVYFYHLFNSDEDDSRSAAAKVLIIR
ncbi:MAG: hypothetical protein MJ010_04630 [Paludibacteraceae bacterium]|nr:hypothetical protein [Paludibacteraceae bacterium]